MSEANLPAKEPAATEGDIIRSRERTLDHEVRRLPDSSLERRRKRHQETVSEQLQREQARGSTRGARWAFVAAVVALAGLLLGAWSYIARHLE